MLDSRNIRIVLAIIGTLACCQVLSLFLGMLVFFGIQTDVWRVWWLCHVVHTYRTVIVAVLAVPIFMMVMRQSRFSNWFTVAMSVIAVVTLLVHVEYDGSTETASAPENFKPHDFRCGMDGTDYFLTNANIIDIGSDEIDSDSSIIKLHLSKKGKDILKLIKAYDANGEISVYIDGKQVSSIRVNEMQPEKPLCFPIGINYWDPKIEKLIIGILWGSNKIE